MCRKLTGCPSTSSDNGYQRLSVWLSPCLSLSQPEEKGPICHFTKERKKNFFYGSDKISTFKPSSVPLPLTCTIKVGSLNCKREKRKEVEGAAVI